MFENELLEVLKSNNLSYKTFITDFQSPKHRRDMMSGEHKTKNFDSYFLIVCQSWPCLVGRTKVIYVDRMLLSYARLTPYLFDALVIGSR